MGQQLNKIQKRRRLKAYVNRRKLRDQAAVGAKRIAPAPKRAKKL